MKRVTTAGGVASIASGMGIVLLIAITNKIMETQGSTGSFLGIPFPVDTDYIAIPSVLVSVFILVIVSLITQSSPAGQFERTSALTRLEEVWEEFGPLIKNWSSRYEVPAELIVATICTNSNGKGNHSDINKQFESSSEQLTPSELSIGLMQTSVSVAKIILNNSKIDKEWLMKPDNSIRAGTAYIASQWEFTRPSESSAKKLS